MDISRYIRSGDTRDVSVFWRATEPTGHEIQLDEPPRREELCPVPIGDIRAWKGRAFALDYLDGKWTERDAKRLTPGMTVLLEAREGGYTVERGWVGKSQSVEPVPIVPEATDPLVGSSFSPDADDLSAAPWKTIQTHGRETEKEARILCAVLGIPQELARIIMLAGRWHDVGKGHDVFQDAITNSARGAVPIGARRDLAKAPKGAWRRPPYPERPGFRHELASTLAVFELLRLANPLHAALLGPHRELLDAIGKPVELPPLRDEHPLAKEISCPIGARVRSARVADLLAPWEGPLRLDQYTARPREINAATSTASVKATNLRLLRLRMPRASSSRCPPCRCLSRVRRSDSDGSTGRRGPSVSPGCGRCMAPSLWRF